MSKEKFVRNKPHCNIGTIGDVYKRQVHIIINFKRFFGDFSYNSRIAFVQ